MPHELMNDSRPRGSYEIKKYLENVKIGKRWSLVISLSSRNLNFVKAFKNLAKSYIKVL